MTKLFISIGIYFLLSCFNSLSIKAQKPASKPFWIDETKVEDNRLPMHASFHVYPNDKEALQNNWESSEHNLSLNGTWKFKWFERPADVPEDASSKSFNDSGWDNFRIPANWEVNNYGFPIYVNIGYEFQNIMAPNPPLVPLNFDPTGVYRREVEVPKEWIGKNIVLHIGAAKSNLMVWVNGQYIGYGEDGKLPSEFDLSSALVAGKNLIVL